MKLLLVVSLSLVLIVGLMGVMKMRRSERDRDSKQYRLQDIKLRVTKDLVDEFQSELAERRNQVMKSQGVQKQMEEEVEKLQDKAAKTTDDMNECQGAQKSVGDLVAMTEAALSEFKAESTKEMVQWKAEVDELKKQLAERSAICDFLKEQTESIRKLCGKKDVGQEQAPAVPKQEKVEAEVPKQEKVEAEVPKQEKVEAEVPKQEKVEDDAPKQEKAEVDAPKQEKPDVQAPK